MTPLDTAHAAMLADPEDDGARLRYYRLLAQSELCVLLETEAVAGQMTPQLFPLESGPVVLAFDTEERLAEFTGMPAPYAALPGRVIAGQLAGQGIGLGVNLGDDASAWLMAPHAVDWLAGMLDRAPLEARGRPVMVLAPEPPEPELAEALAVALAGAGGLAAAAVLALAGWDDGSQGWLLTYLGAAPAAEQQLARALGEALAFSGFEDGAVDVLFLAPEDGFAQQLLAVGQRLALPEPPRPAERPARKAPGMDPAQPPKLR